MILEGLDPCPDGLGHFFGDEVPQSARLSAGGGGEAIWAMPKLSVTFSGGPSLTWGKCGLSCEMRPQCRPYHHFGPHANLYGSTDCSSAICRTSDCIVRKQRTLLCQAVLCKVFREL